MANPRLIYRTMTGIELSYEPVSPIILELAEAGVRKKYLKANEPIETPTYETEIAGGAKQTFEHDETTLLTDEDKALWAKHLDAVRRMSEEMDSLRTKIVLQCIQGVELPKDSAWADRQRSNMVELPDDPAELYYHYLKTEVLKSSADFSGITNAIMRAGYLGQASEEVIEASSALFQDFIQEKAKERLDSLKIPEESDLEKQPG